MSSSDVAVSVRGLSKSYSIAHNLERHTTLGEALLHRARNPFQRAEKEIFWALKGVSFDINKGEVVGVVGRNGAGKSTLLKIVSQITSPTTGEVALFGRVGSLLEVGTGFHPELTGRENIYLNGAILGMQRREIATQFDAIVDFAGVERFLDTPVKRYSSGMYVRLAFAVAAHLNPEILIVDEVLSVGDSEFQKKCLGKMRDVASNGRTVLFVSHNMAAVRELCGRAIWMRSGELHRDAAALEVVTDYLSAGAQSYASAGARAHGASVTNVALWDPKRNETTEHPVMGADYELTATIESCTVLDDCVVVAHVHDDTGKLISAISSLHEGEDPFRFAGRSTVTFPLPHLQLFPGSYFIHLYLYRLYDWMKYIEVANAVRFEVQPSVVRNAAKAYDERAGIVRISEGCTINVLEWVSESVPGKTAITQTASRLPASGILQR